MSIESEVMELIRMVLRDTKRLAIILIPTTGLFYIFMTGEYESFKEAAQAFLYAILRAGAGFILGHIFGKIIVGSVAWKERKITDADVAMRLTAYVLGVWGVVSY